MDALNGHISTWKRKVAESWNEGRVTMDGRQFTIFLEMIEVVTGMENVGQRHNRKMWNLIIKFRHSTGKGSEYLRPRNFPT